MAGPSLNSSSWPQKTGKQIEIIAEGKEEETSMSKVAEIFEDFVIPEELPVHRNVAIYRLRVRITLISL